ncbi:MAG: DUF4056 domain-containing protein [Candidatus Nanoarchaeia archaeon]
MKTTYYILLVIFLIFCLSSFCFGNIPEEFNKKPKWEYGFFFGCPWGFEYYGSDKINNELFLKAKVGLAYTTYGGFIDTNHAGEASWWTIYYQKKIYKNLVDKETNFELPTISKDVFYISISYTNEKLSSEQALEISIELAQYLSYNWTVYHEILTFYDFRIVGLFSEKASSAFSPEDLYSDLLGTIVSSEALKSNQDYNTAYEASLESWLKKLGLQKSQEVKQAYEKTKKKWWNAKGYPSNKLYERNFDIGESGFLTPMLLSYSSESEPNIVPIPLPVPEIPNKYGVSISLSIEAKEKAAKKNLFFDSLKDKKFLVPKSDFPVIMEKIRKQHASEEKEK